MLLGLVLGFGVGINLGLWLASFMMKCMYRDIIDGYRKDTSKWFEEYMQMLKWYQEMRKMYIDEALKNLTNGK